MSEYNIFRDGAVHAPKRIFDVNFMRKMVSAKHPVISTEAAAFELPEHSWASTQDGVRATCRGVRSTGAFARLQHDTIDLMINLDPGSKYPSFVESCYVSATSRCTVQTASVLKQCAPKSFIGNVTSALNAPSQAGANDTERGLLVRSGKLVAGLMARLAALALEHSLVPFTTRLRPRNAASCFWAMNKYKQDGMVYCLQDVNSLMGFLHRGNPGADVDPLFVVYCGLAPHLKGMALLTRLCDAGGPIAGERSFLLEQFSPADILLWEISICERIFRPHRLLTCGKQLMKRSIF